jgi:hypothetical protein
MRTRTKGTTKADVDVTKSTFAKVELNPDSRNPPRIFVLPEDITSEARIISVTNPRYLSKDRYIVCPGHGFYEFKVVAAPKTTPRSWLLSRRETDIEAPSESGHNGSDPNLLRGYVTRTADLFIATPVDPLFFLLPTLSPASKISDPSKRLFLSSDDYFERVVSDSPDLRSFLRKDELRNLLQKRMQAVCETVEAGDEIMYRLNENMVLKEMLQKARTMVERGLPASIEEKLVRKALEVPMLSITRGESSLQELEENDAQTAASGMLTPLSEALDTQTTVSFTDSTASSISQASTAATSFSADPASTTLVQESKMTPPRIVAPDGVANLLRLRVALDFLFSNYITPHITQKINKAIDGPTSSIDFSPLTTHLAHLAKLRQEAAATRSLGDYSRKRSVQDEDVEIRAEKKRKIEEEEKRRKAGESLGVKRLKKANVTGMKKLSEFFKKH